MYQINTDVLRAAFIFKFPRGRIADLVSLLPGRDSESCDYQKSIAEDSVAKLKEGILGIVSTTNFRHYLMIVNFAGMISSAMIRS